jgi:hypothetical protein
VDDEKERDHPDHERGGGHMTHGSGRKSGWKDDMTGEGPTLAKHRATERGE